MNANEFPWATFTMVVLVIVAAITGACVVIWGNPGALNFKDYIQYLSEFAGAVGLLGVGRGIRAGLKDREKR